MQFKSLAIFAAVLSVTHAQSVGFNASQIVTAVEELTNLAELTKGIAGNITLGNAGTQVTALVTSLTNQATAIAEEVADLATTAGGGVLSVADQAQICLSVSQFISSEQSTVATIVNDNNIIDAPPFNALIAAALLPVQTSINSLVNSIAPLVPNCLSTAAVNLGSLNAATTQLIISLQI